jgi:hypothetical protein
MSCDYHASPLNENLATVSPELSFSVAQSHQSTPQYQSVLGIVSDLAAEATGIVE